MLKISYTKKYRVYFLILFYLCLFSIVVLSILPHNDIVKIINKEDSFFLIDFSKNYNIFSQIAYFGETIFGVISDKIRHFVAFMTLGILFDFSYNNLALQIKLKLLIYYGVFIEVLQFFIPYREFSILDILFNILFILLYFKIVSKIVNIKEKD